MSEIAAVLRHCPSCGRRLHVRLTSKKMTAAERKSYLTTRGTADDYNVVTERFLWGARSFGGAPHDGFVKHEGKVRVTIEKDVFQYDFRCGNCGHEWTEKKVKELEPRVERKQS